LFLPSDFRFWGERWSSGVRGRRRWEVRVVANTIAASAALTLGSWVGWDILDNNLCEMKLVAIEPSCFILK
jgi:hypothetical protein